MAELRSGMQRSASGVTPVQQPTQSFDVLGAVTQVADTGLSLFAANARNQQAIDKKAADDIKMEQQTLASNASSWLADQVQQIKATKGGLAAQTAASQLFTQLQGSLPVGAREMFVDDVKKTLGFNPINASTNQMIKEEEAREAKFQQDKTLATQIYMASVDMNNPDAVRNAMGNVERMDSDQLAFIINSSAAEDLRVQKAIQQHNLIQEQHTTADVKRNQAQRVASTIVSAGFNKLTAGFQVRLSQAIQSGDPNTIMQVQKDGLQSLQALRAGLQDEAIGYLQSAGIQDIDLSTLNAQLQPVFTQINALESAFKMTDLQTATEANAKWTITQALYRTASENTEKGKVASAILSDQLFGTNFGATYIENAAMKDVIHNAVVFNNGDADAPDDKAAVKLMEDTVNNGSVQTLLGWSTDTPNLAEIASVTTNGQIHAMRVGIDKPDEIRSELAQGVLNNWEATFDNNSPIAIRSKVFEPSLDFFTNPKNANAYKQHLAGTEDTFLMASLQYIKGNVMPSLSQAVGMTNNDLNGQFTVEVQDGKFRLTPRPISATATGGPVADAAQLAGAQRRSVAKAASKTEALLNKILLAYSNLYDTPLNSVTSLFAERYADALGVQLVEIEEDNNEITE